MANLLRPGPRHPDHPGRLAGSAKTASDDDDLSGRVAFLREAAWESFFCFGDVWFWNNFTSLIMILFVVSFC